MSILDDVYILKDVVWFLLRSRYKNNVSCWAFKSFLVFIARLKWCIPDNRHSYNRVWMCSDSLFLVIRCIKRGLCNKPWVSSVVLQSLKSQKIMPSFWIRINSNVFKNGLSSYSCVLRYRSRWDKNSAWSNQGYLTFFSFGL